MIVHKPPSGHLIVGLTTEDISKMSTGLVCSKPGTTELGFRSLIVFTGESDKDLKRTLMAQLAAQNNPQPKTKDLPEGFGSPLIDPLDRESM